MKKSFALSVGLVLLVTGLVACNGSDNVKVAVVLPLSGPVETYGQSIKRGVDLAYEQVVTDAALPQSIELVYRDSQSDPDKAAAALGELYDGGALVGIGGVTSAEAIAMVKVADGKDRILLSPSASSPELTGASRNFFRVFPSDFVEGNKMANFAANNLKVETAVIVGTESPYGRGIQGIFENELERQGGEVLETLEYPPGTSDFSGFVARVMTLKPDAVYVAAYWDEIVRFIRALKEAGYQGKILTTSAFATPQGIAEAGDAAEGVFFTQTVFELSADSGPTHDFVEAYRAKYGDDPDLYAAHGYDAMLIVAEALKQGGALPSAFWKGMRAIRSYPGATGAIQFDEKGDVQKFPRVYMIRDGEPVNYEEHVRQVKEAFRKRLRELEEQQRRLRQGSGS